MSVGSWLVRFTLCAALIGCAHERGSGCCGARTPLPDIGIPSAGQSNLEEEFQSLARFVPGNPTTSFERSAIYRAVSDRECQCQAARSSPVANLLENEAKSLAERRQRRCASLRHKRSERDELLETVLVDRSLELRNRAAGTALDAYYRLAEAEARRTLAEASLKELNVAALKAEELRQRGLRSPAEEGILRRQQLGMQADQGQLLLAVNQLQGQLAELLGAHDCASPWQVWPEGWGGLCPAPVDVDAAIAIGLASRPELVLLGTLRQELNANTLSVARQLLLTLDPLLGAEGRKANFLMCLLTVLGREPVELARTRHQFEEYEAARRRQVAGEIRLAALAVGTRVDLVAIARARAMSWDARVAELQELYSKGLLAYGEVTSARLERLKARADVVKEVAGLQIANARLRQAQGLLVQECGYMPVGCGAARVEAERCDPATMPAGPATLPP